MRDRAAGAPRKKTIAIEGTQFIARFLQHVLPPGFKRIRHYGLLANAGKRARLAAARAALDQPPPAAALIESIEDFMHRIGRWQALCCPHCRAGRWQVVAPIARVAAAAAPIQPVPWHRRAPP